MVVHNFRRTFSTYLSAFRIQNTTMPYGAKRRLAPKSFQFNISKIVSALHCNVNVKCF